MSPRRSLTTLRKKTRQTKAKSKKGIFIVERRKQPRFSMELPLDYCIERKDRIGGVTANASRGGLLVYLPEAIVVGTLLKIEVLCRICSKYIIKEILCNLLIYNIFRGKKIVELTGIEPATS